MAAHHAISGQQLQMFMTPNEIHSRYQALDGDREDAERLTSRSRNTWDHSNYRVNTGERSWYEGTGTHVTYGSESDDQLYARKAEEARMPPGEYAELHGGRSATPGYETLMDRGSAPVPRGSGTSAMDSHDDAMNSYVNRKQGEHYDRQAWGDSLYDKIAAQGVLSPIHLGQQFGSLDKPQVVGGHHRLAVQTELNPNQPIPVLHHKDIWAARESGYEYT